MQLSLLQENFNTALQSVSRFVPSRSQLPILSTILLQTDQGRLKLTATDLNIGINYWIGAKIITDGSITLPSKEITEFVSYLTPGKIDLQLDSNRLLHLSSTRLESTFTTTPPSDFPALPQINQKTAINLDLALLTDTISQVAFAAATDDSRPVLTAVLCCFSQDRLVFAATDGFRLSLKDVKLPRLIKLKPGQDQLTFLIPARSLSEVVKLAKNTKEITFGLTTDHHQLIFVFDDIELITRLIEGEFPDYQKIIPDSYATKIVLDKDEFSQNIKIASVFARESANVVRFSIKKNFLELTANAPQIGTNQVKQDARVEGEPLEIAFNYKFISDFLSVVTGQEIVIELNEALTPAFFHYPQDPTFTHIIMPVRIQD